MLKVHIGYTKSGRNRWKRFPLIEQANAYCEQERQRTGHVLTVLEDTLPPRRRGTRRRSAISSSK